MLSILDNMRGLDVVNKFTYYIHCTHIYKVLFHPQATQNDDPTKYRTAEIKFTVEPNNLSPPAITTNTVATTGYVYEGQNAGAVIRGAATGTGALQIQVTDPDVVY